MRNQKGKIEKRQKTLHSRKMIFLFKLDMYMFFYQISRIFSCFLIVWWFDFIWSFYYHFRNHFTILESQFIGNREIFWTKKKKILLSLLNTVGGIMCGDIISNWSKIKNIWQFHTDWFASLRTWYYFRIYFSFSYSGYDLTVIKKS